MTITMDSAGRLVLPKSVRERAHLRAGIPLDVRVVDGRVEIEPAAAEVRLEQRSGFWVAAPTGAVPVLTTDEVDAVTQSVRVPLDGLPGEDA